MRWRRTDTSDDGELATQVAEADMFAQLSELHALGMTSRSHMADGDYIGELDGPLGQAALWTKVVRDISSVLIRKGTVTSAEFGQIVETAN
jgi:hypothetical protein